MPVRDQLGSSCFTIATTRYPFEDDKIQDEAQYLLAWDQKVYPRRRDIKVDITMKGRGPPLDGQLATVLQQMAVSEAQDFTEVVKIAVLLYEEGLHEQLSAFNDEFTHIYDDLRRSISNALTHRLPYEGETEWSERLASSGNERPHRRRRQGDQCVSNEKAEAMRFDLKAQWANDASSEKRRKVEGPSLERQCGLEHWVCFFNATQITQPSLDNPLVPRPVEVSSSQDNGPPSEPQTGSAQGALGDPASPTSFGAGMQHHLQHPRPMAPSRLKLLSNPSLAAENKVLQVQEFRKVAMSSYIPDSPVEKDQRSDTGPNEGVVRSSSKITACKLPMVSAPAHDVSDERSKSNIYQEPSTVTVVSGKKDATSRPTVQMGPGGKNTIEGNLSSLHDRRFNAARFPDSGISETERKRLFKDILTSDPSDILVQQVRPPHGAVGDGVRIEAPFSCEFGYNINLKDGVVIGAGCHLEDAGRKFIGSRTVIDPNVRLYTVVMPADMRLRNGVRTLATTAPITIQEDCYIGADVIIQPGQFIAKGSFVRASSVVA
ncbi:Hypothetical protein D9617_48g089540 [Elsinoe fawcettii]|nr:Hypothetical protein D9617_48g089540 [Elsinoe fawcettii]